MKKKQDQDYKMPSPEETKMQALGVKRELYTQPSTGKEGHREQDASGRRHLRKGENPASNV